VSQKAKANVKHRGNAEVGWGKKKGKTTGTMGARPPYTVSGGPLENTRKGGDGDKKIFPWPSTGGGATGGEKVTRYFKVKA